MVARDSKLTLEEELEKCSPEYLRRYEKLKAFALSELSTRWASGFPEGTDHGPGHVERVLGHLSSLVGRDPISQGVLNCGETFILLASAVLHDAGLVLSRDDHADLSQLLVDSATGRSLLGEHEASVVAPVVGAHSEEDNSGAHSALVGEVLLASDRIDLPKVAAFVRIADKLDIDHRRAPTVVQQAVRIPPESSPYWEFHQRVSGTQAIPEGEMLIVGISFEQEDCGRSVLGSDGMRSFLGFCACRLLVLDRVREAANAALPRKRQYRRTIVDVRLVDSAGRRKTRSLLLDKTSSEASIVRALPELVDDIVAEQMIDLLECIRTRRLRTALEIVKSIECLGPDLSSTDRLRLLYNTACVESLLSEDCAQGGRAHLRHLDHALEHLLAWIGLGLDGAWPRAGMTARHELFRMSLDSDLWSLLSSRRNSIREAVPAELRDALSPDPPKRPRGSSGRGGCVERCTRIEVPTGFSEAGAIRPRHSVVGLNLRSLRREKAIVQEVFQSRVSSPVKVLTHQSSS